MPNPTDPAAQIRQFLMSHPGQHCEPCLVKGTALDAKVVKAAFRPSKHNAYSFMQAVCGCGKRAVCVAYAGESDSARDTAPVSVRVASGR